MTNELKAIELANKWAEYRVFYRAKISAMEMAEWKDHQFKEYLEKKRDETLGKVYNLPLHRVELLNEILNELFGE